MTSTHHRVILILAGVLAHGPIAAAQHPDMPPGMTHEEHAAQMAKEAALRENGGVAMGFDQQAAVHHFRLAPAGGAVAVDVRRPDDEATRGQIRAHLREIAAAFARGDFGKPFLTHGEEPPGVPAMRKLAGELAYVYEDTATGGLVRIVTASPQALEAVHAFIRYQITEHGTGDPLTIPR
jgi:hypothetical protein